MTAMELCNRRIYKALEGLRSITCYLEFGRLPKVLERLGKRDCTDETKHELLEQKW
jgi:hypothetical protein